MTDDISYNRFYYHASSTGGRRAYLLMSREWLLDRGLSSLLLRNPSNLRDYEEDHYILKNMNPHDMGSDFLCLNPSGVLPVLELYKDGGKRYVISGGQAVTEYIISHHYKDSELWGRGDDLTRALIRTFVNYVDVPFEREVVAPIVKERLHIGWDIAEGHRTDYDNLSRARTRLKAHMGYFEYILDEQRNFVGDHYTLADTAVAASITLLDYLSEIEWQDYPNVKGWYIIQKPLCKCLLREQIPGIEPREEYNRLTM